MRLTINLDMDNAALEDDAAETGRVILAGLTQIERLQGADGSVGLWDINGNSVGYIEVVV